MYLHNVLGINVTCCKALPGSSSVNTVQHATKGEAVFSIDPTDAPIDWLESVYRRSMSVPRLYNESHDL
jgi:hypothetical protein